MHCNMENQTLLFGGNHCFRVLTFLSYDDTKQGIGQRDSFVEVVIVVDWQKVSVDVRVSQQDVHSWDAVDRSD